MDENECVGSRIPRLVLHDTNLLIRLLRNGRALLVEHPQAARAVIRGLVEEGRRFAATKDGKDWQNSLAGTKLVRQGRMVWQAYGLDSLLQEGVSITPSEWIEGVLQALDECDIESSFVQLMQEGVRHGGVGGL